MTPAVWKSEETFETAKKATMTGVQMVRCRTQDADRSCSGRGFNPREVVARLKVEIKEPFVKALLMNNIFGVMTSGKP